jgi:hypothetical protein
VLGPLTVVRGGAELPAFPPGQRVVLGLLAAACGSAVPLDSSRPRRSDTTELFTLIDLACAYAVSGQHRRTIPLTLRGIALSVKARRRLRLPSKAAQASKALDRCRATLPAPQPPQSRLSEADLAGRAE